jgi:hypothetical protein
MNTLHMQVLIFRTNINSSKEMNRLSPLLDQLANGGRWSVDLDDCDKVLRLISDSTSTQEVISYITDAGFFCEELV